MRGWRELAKLAIGNTRLMLFLAAGLSGPVAALLGVEQVGIMLVGDPATGKTTVIIVVGSMWGRHVDQNKALEPGLAQTFNATDNSLEDDHLAANYTVLCLDETRSQGIPDKEIGPAFGGPVMRLSSGFEKGWQNATAPRRSSAVPILVSSNLSLQQFANQARIKIDDALHSRMIAVPLRPGDHGVYEKIHGSKDGAQFSAQLRKIAEEDFGHPSREFPKALTAENARDPEKLRRWLEARREFFLRSAKDISSPMQNLDRTKAKFATVYAAACFAIKHNILPWKSKAVAQSLRACLFDHVMQVAREAPFTEVAGTGGPAGGAKTVPHQPLVQLRDFVRANHDKVLDLATAGTSDRLPKDGSDWPILKSSHKEYGPEYLFTDKALLALLGDKSHVQQLKLSLNEAGHIATDKGSGGDL